MTRDNILNFLRHNKTLLRQRFGITSISLFGSYARGDANKDSDIDLLIETNNKSFRNRYTLKKFLEESFQKKVDIGYLSSLHPFIKKQVEKEMVSV